MRSKLIVIVVFLMMFAVGVQADSHCSDEIGCVVLAPDDPVTIGVMSALSGPVAFLGEDSVGGVEIALNQRGRMVLDREIELVTEDSICSAEGGQTAAQKIASDEQILGVVGTSCSGAAVSALPVISAAGMLMISPSNTSPALTNPDVDAGGLWQPGYYRTAHNDEFQGAMAAEYALNELGANTVATIHDGDPYTDGLQAVMARTFAELGGEVVFQGAVNKGDTDMTAILTEIATDPPDVLYFPIFEPEGNFVAAQSQNIPGLEDTILMGADGLLVASFPEASGDAAIGMYLSGPYLSSDDYSDFLAEWDAEFGGSPPSGFHAHAYDAANILLDAIAAVAVEQEDGSVVIGRQALRDAVSATVDYEGLTGVLTCNETGDCATGEALGMYLITEAEVNEGNWPPAIIWSKADSHCSDEIGCVVLAPDDPVTIGVMSALSGPVAFYGEDAVGGVEIALNRRGRMVLDREIELVSEDSICSAEGGQTAGQKIASDEQILGVVGTSCSSAAASALPVISAAGMLMISPSNTSPALTNPDVEAGGLWQPGYYRTAHNDEFQGAMAAEYALNELGANTVATIHDGDPYTEGLQAVMARTFAELGGTVVFQGAVNKGDTDMTAILTEIATDPPDVLYFPVFEPEGNFVAAQSQNIPGLEDTILMGADGLLVASFPEASGDAAIGMYLSGPYLSSDDYSDFLAEWDAEFGGSPPSGFHAHAYDAANILLDAIAAVAVEQEDGSVVIGRQALRDAVSATAGYEGLTGVLTCNETGDCATGEALGMYLITEAEVNEGNWPPAIIWSKADAEDDM